MYVYICSEPQLWTVGFYDPAGNWQAESDHGTTEEAVDRVAFLNGNSTLPLLREAIELLREIARDVNQLTPPR